MSVAYGSVEPTESRPPCGCGLRHKANRNEEELRDEEDGSIGDGKIFVLDLPECVRIRTGETGGVAIG